ncbi:MAG: gliding motility-associated C-terminal domain-containing protein [Cytophagaceae bacterium]
MKKVNILFFPLIFLLWCQFNVFAQDARISGGNNVSAMICGNGEVYSWGYNAAGAVGSLGNGSASTIVNAPRKVLFPTNDSYFNFINQAVTMYQVDAGSGQSFVSLDCHGGVWGWGFNNNATMGITGTGSSASAVTTPARVLRGETPGGASIHPSLSNYLVDVKYVVGGNSSGYAILKNGRGVAWGDNSTGQLGDGTTTHSPTPRYIRTATGILENIIQIDAGDQTGYALVDPDGDGIGTVYSWGSGAVRQLGRNAAGTANGGNEGANDQWARPVINANGTPLTNIVSLAAGDAMCFAIDKDGLLWAWGNNGWGGLTGQGNTITHSDPKPVVSGEWSTTAGVGFGEPFLKVRSAAAGNGFGMAITIDGKPMTWGNNGACGTSAAGGSLGDGTTTGKTSPVFIRRSGGVIDNNVVRISGGDTWGFYITLSDQIYAWGNNANGTLGIGNTTCQNFAVSVTPACSFPDPTPTALISPRDKGVCSPFSQILNSGFAVNSSIVDRYQITWEKSIDGGTNWTIIPGANNSTYTANEPGMYKVKIHYTGTNIPCAQDAVDVVNLSAFTAPFTPNNGTFCTEENGTFSVTGTSGYNGWYNWYNTPSGGASLNGTYTSSITIPFTQAESVDENTYRLWVEDKYGIEAYTRPELPSSCSRTGTTPTNYHHKFTVTSTLNLESVMAMHYTNSNAGTWDQFRVVIFADNAGSVGASVFTGNLSSYLRGPVGGYLPITIPVNYTVSAGTYWLQIQSTTSGLVGNYNCSVSYPQNDNSGQDLLSITTTRQFGNISSNFGTAFNWKITRGSAYPCGRIPVIFSKVCPACQPPNAVSITEPENGTTHCIGNAITIKGSADLAGLGGSYYYQWFKGSTPIGSASSSYSDLVLNSVTSADAGTYSLRVENGNNGDADCFKEASVQIFIANPETATYKIEENCGSTTIIPDNPPQSVKYYWQTVEGGTDLNNEANAAVNVNLTGTYFIRAFNTVTGCWSLQTTTIAINSIRNIPSDVPALTPVNNCGSSIISPGVSPAEIEYHWQLSDGGTQNNPANSDRTVTADGTYFIRAFDPKSNCWSLNTTSVEVSVRQIPDDVPQPDLDVKCGSTDIIIPESPAGVEYHWQTSDGGTDNDPASGVRNITVSDVFYLRSFDPLSNCWSAGTTAVQINIINNPDQPGLSTSDQICGGPIVITATSNEVNQPVYKWYYEGSEIAGQNNSSISVSVSGNYSVEVIRGGCISEPAAINVEISPIPEKPIIEISSSPVCEGETVTLTAKPNTGGLEYEWYNTSGVIAGEISNVYTTSSGGKYWVIAKGNTAPFCQSQASEEVNVIVNPIPEVPVLTQSGPACGGPKTIAATGNGTINWFESGNAITVNGNSFNISAPDTYSYTATLTISGCTSDISDPLNVVIHRIPEVPSLSVTGNNPICSGESVVLNMTTVETGVNSLWYKDDVVLEGVIDNSYTTNLGGYYKVQIINAITGCSSTSPEVLVSVYPVTTIPYAGKDTATCSSLITLVGNQYNLISENASWTTTGSAQIVPLNNSEREVVVSGLSPGINKFIWTIEGACETLSDTIEINSIDSKAEVSFSSMKDTVCMGVPVTLHASVSKSAAPYKYYWFSSEDKKIDSLITNDSEITISKVPSGSGAVVFNLFIEDNNKCRTNKYYDTVYVIDRQKLLIPNLFTPNDDGKNDAFIVRDENKMPLMEGAYLEVYNRWGERVYKSGNYDNSWKAENISDGLYYYYIKTGCGNDEFTGWLHIVGNKGN